ncbi:SDR family oxidoreductase [Bacillus horti]|uniref:3-oxoacyl-[acyl-carrier protein] reductase n=1 Tax=Caldalkalibacillus horti TaxID=77523 RepID=A0ABT9VW03_9BACI|nr:SDR family oxidoreductase [Bacillus horti]MDQ0165049.1 3-oxoacyl-[acyl-carrier protein] reductase [Bacillus horti]
MDLGLQGKKVLVLASSKGLGRATATQFAAEGADVMLTSRKEEELIKTAAEIKEQTGRDVSYFVADVSKGEDLEKLIAATAERFGTIDVLVNNSGGPPAGKFDDFNDQDWYNAFELTLLSYIRTIRGVLPYMKKQKSGRIINITSSSIKQPIENLLLSNTLRLGVVGLAKSLALELAKDQILINTVGPGQIRTDRVVEFDEAKAKELGTSIDAVQSSKQEQIAIGRYGEPDEFAKTLLFLGSFANTYVTGQTLLVDGGLVKAI